MEVLARASSLVVAVAVLVVASACSGDDDTSRTEAGGDDSDPAGAPTTAAPPSGDGDGHAGDGEGCSGDGPAVPEDRGAGVGEIVDVDGDGREDTGWLAVHHDGTRTLGVATAAGGGDVAPVESASPGLLTVLVVDADEEPPVELLVSDGGTAWLWAFAECRLAPVAGPGGEPYLFDLGVRGDGTGVACRGTGEGRQLVGLDVVHDDGTVVEWTRTVVERHGLSASHGETDRGRFERPGDAEAIERLHTVSCGDTTMDDDGIRQPLL